ncbi:hypothetical protein [Glycomyces sp. MUSA5-2]|uniref:hypothetical protein n=1 Tax=Glycomyces sp. MUSA5-2 TaxID=2053002 RepID=UPI0030080A78
MTETTYPTADAARAAAVQDFPDALEEPDLSAFFGGRTRVLYDAGSHTVLLVDTGNADGSPGECVVETIAGHELPGHPAFYETLEGGVSHWWGADNTETLAVLEAMTRIYIAAQRTRGFVHGPTGDAAIDVRLPLEQIIDRLRQQLVVWEAVQTRFLRAEFAAAAADGKLEHRAEELRVSRSDWIDMIAADRRRFGTLE